MLQYVSINLDYVLPAHYYEGTERAFSFWEGLQSQAMLVQQLGSTITDSVYRAYLPQAAAHRRTQPLLARLHADPAVSAQLQPLLLSPHFLSDLIADLAAKAFHVRTIMEALRRDKAVDAAKMRLQLGSGSSSVGGRTSSSGGSSVDSNSSSSSSGSSEGPQHGPGSNQHAQAWANAWADCLQHFSPCEQLLFQLLRINPRTMICVVGSHALDMAVVQLFMACEVYSITTGYIKQQQQQQQQGSCVLQKAHLLLVPVLLHCAVELLHCPVELLPANANHRHQLFCSMVLLSVAQEAFQMVQWQKQRSNASEQGVGGLGFAPPAVWVSEMLPLTLKVTEVLTSQQQQQQLLVGAGATGVPSQPSSSSGSGSRRNSNAVSSSSSSSGGTGVHPDPEAHAVIRTAATVESLLLLGRTMTATMVCDGNVNADGCISTEPAEEAAAVLGRVMSAVEGALRVIMQGVQAQMPCARAPRAINIVALLCGKGGNDARCIFMVMLQAQQYMLQQQQQDSEVYKQYYSLLSTLLKYSSCAAVQAQEDLASVQAVCCYSVASAAVQLLQRHVTGGLAYSSSGAGQLVPSDWQSAGSAVKGEAEHVLPSLVLLGRCVLQWAQQLPSEAAMLRQQQGQQQQQGRQLQEQQPLFEDSAASICLTPSSCSNSSSSNTASKAEEWLPTLLGGVQAWLEEVLVEVQAVTMGYHPLQLQQQVAALLVAQAAAQSEMIEGSVAELAKQLQATGRLLSNVAVPNFCNNPCCSSVGVCSEVQLVSGRSCLCAGCLTGRYCSRRVRSSIGSSTSQFAKLWRQQRRQQQRLQQTVCRGHNARQAWLQALCDILVISCA